MNNQFSFLDLITILSFMIGLYALEIALQNLDENREQEDDLKNILERLNDHLLEQDKLLGKEI